MQKRKFIPIVLMVLWSLHIFSQETINIIFYNLLNFPEAPPSNRPEILKAILDNYQPDLFMVCELQSEIGTNTVLSSFPRTEDDKFRAAQFETNQSSSSNNLQQLVFYNCQKFILEDQRIITTSTRDINHYIFILNTKDSSVNPIYLDVFVTPLKSSQGFENEQLRLQMVTEFTNYQSNNYIQFKNDNVISKSIVLELDTSIITKKNNVYNSMGQIVKSSLIEKTITNIDATNLANGIYYISLQNSYNFTPLKFIKI